MARYFGLNILPKMKIFTIANFDMQRYQSFRHLSVVDTCIIACWILLVKARRMTVILFLYPTYIKSYSYFTVFHLFKITRYLSILETCEDRHSTRLVMAIPTSHIT